MAKKARETKAVPTTTSTSGPFDKPLPSTPSSTESDVPTLTTSDAGNVSQRTRHPSQTSLLIEYFEAAQPSGNNERPSVRVRVKPSESRSTPSTSKTRKLKSGEVSHISIPPRNRTNSTRKDGESNQEAEGSISDRSYVESTHIGEKEKVRRKKSKNKDRNSARDAALMGLAGAGLTAAALRHHNSREWKEDRKEQRKRRSRSSRSRTASISESIDKEYLREDVPPLPILQSEAIDADLTRQSILSAETEPRELPGFRSSRHGNVSKSSINNPKLLETVEDAIRRLILPELDRLKEEQGTRSKSKGKTSSRQRSSKSSSRSHPGGSSHPHGQTPRLSKTGGLEGYSRSRIVHVLLDSTNNVAFKWRGSRMGWLPALHTRSSNSDSTSTLQSKYLAEVLKVPATGRPLFHELPTDPPSPRLHHTSGGYERVPWVFSDAALKLKDDFVDSTLLSFAPDDDDAAGPLYGWEQTHQVFASTAAVPLIACGPLGSGSLGVVEEVKHSSLNFRSLVRKTVQLPHYRREARLKIIQEEARNLARLAHPHIVKIIASYEDKTRPNRHLYCLLMNPVGEHDLKTFLDIAGDESDEARWLQYTEWIHSWFSCLASALAYMHEQGIRHQDIKPSNIITKGRHVYFTDFSSAARFDVGKTTSTENPARSSAMYGAPEVVSKRSGHIRKHGRLSDIFSLGSVFCEMLTVTYGRTVHAFHDFLCPSLDHEDVSDTSSESSFTGDMLLFSRKTDRIQAWCEREMPASQTFYNKCIAPMLARQRQNRPSALEVVSSLSDIEALYPGICPSCRCATPIGPELWNLPGIHFNLPIHHSASSSASEPETVVAPPIEHSPGTRNGDEIPDMFLPNSKTVLHSFQALNGWGDISGMVQGHKPG